MQARVDEQVCDVTTGSGAGQLSFDVQPSKWRVYASVGILFLLSTVAWMDRSVIAMVIAPIKAHFHIGDGQIGLVAGLAFSAFYVLFLIPIGWLADRSSPRVILFLGVLTWSLATIGFGLASSFGVLVIARMAVGAGEGVVTPIAAATIGRLFGRERMAAPMSLFSLGSSAGTAVGVLVAGRILTLGAAGRGFIVPPFGRLEAWQFIYILIGLPGLVAAFLAFTLAKSPIAKPPPAQRAAIATGGSWRFIRQNPRAFCCTVLGFVLVNTAVTSVLTWMPEHLRRAFALAPGTIGWYMATVSLGAPLICQLGIGLIVNRLIARGMVDAPLRVMRWLIVGALPFGSALWWAATPIATGIAMFGVLALIFASNPLGTTAVQLIAPDHLRSGLAAVHLAVLGLVGIGLGSSLVAAIEQYLLPSHDLGAALGLAVCGCLIAAAALLRVAEPAVRLMLETDDRHPGTVAMAI